MTLEHGSESIVWKNASSGCVENAVANRDIVAIGTSAGGVEALIFLARRFSPDFPAAVLVTIHLPSGAHSGLDQILARNGALPASFARDGDPLKLGHIFLAPPGRHLLLDGATLSIGIGPRENNVRPAIDPMLRSAAVCCGHRSIGVVLTGTQSDGASGLWALRRCGGFTIVQQPEDAAFPEMPLAALNRAKPDNVAPLSQMPALLERLVREPAGEPQSAPASLKYEVEIARNGMSSMDDMDRIGRRSVLACPDCHGVMWEIDEGDLIRFRCHTGHAYTAETMDLAIDETLRRALSSALRALEERVALLEKLRLQADASGHWQSAQSWASKKAEFETEAEIVRQAIRRADAIAARAA